VPQNEAVDEASKGDAVRDGLKEDAAGESNKNGLEKP
jgi:hypothetical protein